jgi:hypothetical protein
MFFSLLQWLHFFLVNDLDLYLHFVGYLRSLNIDLSIFSENSNYPHHINFPLKLAFFPGKGRTTQDNIW